MGTDFDDYGLFGQSERLLQVGLEKALSVSKNPFRHADRLQKSSEDKQLTPVGVQRYGRA